MSNDFDLDNLAQSTDRTARVPVGQRPDGVEVGFVIHGPGSERYKAADRALQVLNVRQGIERRKTEKTTPTDQELAERIVDATAEGQMLLLEHCVADWYGFQKGGVDQPYSVEGLRTVLAARPAWAKRLANAVEDELNFSVG